jgi:hypothetical protein
MNFDLVAQIFILRILLSSAAENTLSAANCQLGCRHLHEVVVTLF